MMDRVHALLKFWLSLSGLLILWLPLNAQGQTAPGKTLDLNEVKLLGIKLSDAGLNQVRQHLWDIGGFQQARSTVRQRNIDKFFTWSRLRDSYYVEFRYNHAGKVTSAKRLYRPYSIEASNRRTAISTREVALGLIAELGQPHQVMRKGWGGTLSYSSFIWEDDKMKITVDREGSELLGNVFVEYQVKTQSEYDVAQAAP
ncbi:hypothetical protein QCB44_04775 [Thiomicrorhabdus sp. zzn3]|uniref:hypothetical protein n=1 Tax=Thiomicrorhabdus sp. zzn3 TaxID=3039775 RepID=UPI00243654C1|nr:hypothetical protein [Thiomicrorhabdus sp. zzn3]MDG6778019.1 hypothetical protein [Thiomicrorhabdus sp. zzn3]